ncbi:hypothetical protein SAMN06264849_10449 [Melghirimyces algeriensis]|uniref:Uncharacterized protein n=1 Tax=Melghirimyces algeriensis TaxID=910412 RepID=A0A521CKM9_9BACL|nr:hypothetical protein SAMN06264849_10449 [Melghirimyces algeriensis]
MRFCVLAQTRLIGLYFLFENVLLYLDKMTKWEAGGSS